MYGKRLGIISFGHFVVPNIMTSEVHLNAQISSWASRALREREEKKKSPNKGFFHPRVLSFLGFYQVKIRVFFFPSISIAILITTSVVE